MPSFEIVSTPNPNSLKFDAIDFTYLEGGMVAASNEADAEGHPLAARLWAIEGVSNVFLTPDFLTVTKDPRSAWDALLPTVESVLRAYLHTLE